jgi:structural maintenance of chromosome 2
LVAEKRGVVEERNAHVEALKRQIAGIDEELVELERKREQELTKGGKVKNLLEKSKSLQHDLVKAKTTLDFKVSSIEEEKKKLTADESALTALQKARVQKANQLDIASTSFSTLKSDFDASTSELNKQDELLQSLLTGMAAKSSTQTAGGQGGYMGQLADARSAISAAGTEIEQSKLKIRSLEKEIKVKEPQAKKAEKEGAGLLKQLEAAKDQALKLSSALSASGWDENKEREILQRKSDLSRKVTNLLETRDRIKSSLARINFEYSDPEPGFDRSKVKGLVATLMDLKAENHKYSTALEICAGGRLYNVIVEDDDTGAKLLKGAKLRQRVTLIPLTKISGFVAASQKIGAAQQIAGDPSKVHLALSLVGYDDEVSKAMEWVFGNTLICANAETAKKVTFDNRVKMRSVTLDGDVYDPAGTLSGGSQAQSGGLLIKVQELRAVESEVAAAKGELGALERDEQGAKQEMVKWGRSKRELDLRRHEVALLEGQVTCSNATRIVSEVAAARKTIDELQAALTAALDRQKDSTAEAKRLEKEMAEFEHNKDSKIDELKARVKLLKAAVQRQSSTVKLRQNEVRTMELELEGADKEIREATHALEESRRGAQLAQEELLGAQKDIDSMHKEAGQTEAALKKERAALSAFDEGMNALETARKSKKQEIADTDLELKKLRHDLEKAEYEVTAVEKSIKAIEGQYEWIVEEQKLFGHPGTAYDFRKHNMSEVRRMCRKLEEQHSGLKKKVNTKVMNMIDSVEKKESELKSMLSTVLGDKSKIEETIAELDRYKRDALQTTWRKVNG